MKTSIDHDLVDRFAADLNRLSPADRIGIAVSGGPDSIALLLLMHSACPGRFEAATVDHRLRKESPAEAVWVAEVCRELGIPHRTLDCTFESKPQTAIQELARDARYALLGSWAAERHLTALATAHHADDQAETLMMRLARGAGVRGLAGMRARAVTPGQSSLPLLRPLLGWSKRELSEVCRQAGLTPVADPSNLDDQFERVRVRKSLADLDWLPAAALSKAARNLADTDEAIEWAVEAEWTSQVEHSGAGYVYSPAAPVEVRRRIVSRIVALLGSEGDRGLKGAELDRVLAALVSGTRVTLRGVICMGGEPWRFEQAPPRRAPEQR